VFESRRIAPTHHERAEDREVFISAARGEIACRNFLAVNKK